MTTRFRYDCDLMYLCRLYVFCDSWLSARREFGDLMRYRRLVCSISRAFKLYREHVETIRRPPQYSYT